MSRVPQAPARSMPRVDQLLCARCAAAAVADVREGFRRAGSAQLSWLRGLHLEAGDADASASGLQRMGRMLQQQVQPPPRPGGSPHPNQLQAGGRRRRGGRLAHVAAGGGASSLGGESEEEEWEVEEGPPPSGPEYSPTAPAGEWGSAAGALWARRGSGAGSGSGGGSGAAAEAPAGEWGSEGELSKAETADLMERGAEDVGNDWEPPSRPGSEARSSASIEPWPGSHGAAGGAAAAGAAQAAWYAGQHGVPETPDPAR